MSRPKGAEKRGRGPLRVLDRHTVVPCAFCGAVKRWPENFINRSYSQCLTCWLRKNEAQVEPMRAALAEYDGSTA